MDKNIDSRGNSVREMAHLDAADTHLLGTDKNIYSRAHIGE
jgi:hypothetical protein